MSSVYSSRRLSFSESVPHPLSKSKSVPATPAKASQRPVFRTVPDTPRENLLLLDEHGLDLSILTHKLQLYQLELEEADLRRKHKRTIQDKEAVEVAAAARFRDELERRKHSASLLSMEGKEPRPGAASIHQFEGRQVHSRSASIHKFEDTESRSRSTSISKSEVTGSRSRSESIRKSESNDTRSRSTSIHKSEHGSPRPSVPRASFSKSLRMKRPEPLLLPHIPVTPQEVQSAALPVSRARGSTTNMAEMKKHWRRTTISAGRQSNSKIILLSSTGKSEYCDFGVPPVPQLTASISSAASPPNMSPMTPVPHDPLEPTEDQIRRELETFALEEGPNIQMSRRSSVGSRKRMPVAFVPDPEDVMPSDAAPPPLPPPPPPSEVPSALVEVPDTDMPPSPQSPSLGRKKSFFSRFEKKNDVDALLDLYMTDEQLNEEKVEKKKATRTRRQTFFKRWQSTDALFHKAEKPG